MKALCLKASFFYPFFFKIYECISLFLKILALNFSARADILTAVRYKDGKQMYKHHKKLAVEKKNCDREEKKCMREMVRSVASFHLSK